MTKAKPKGTPKKGQPLRIVGFHDRDLAIPLVMAFYPHWPVRDVVGETIEANREAVGKAEEILISDAKRADHAIKPQDAYRAVELSVAYALRWAARQSHLIELEAEDNPEPWKSEALYLRVHHARDKLRERVLVVLNGIACSSLDPFDGDPSCTESLEVMFRSHYPAHACGGITDFAALDPYAVAAVLAKTSTATAGASSRDVAALAADGLRPLTNGPSTRGRHPGARDSLVYDIARIWLSLGIVPGMSYELGSDVRGGAFPNFVRLIASVVGLSGPGIEGLGEKAFRKLLAQVKNS